MAKKGALTPKQEAFCRFVVELGNQTEAYARAFEHKGTRKTAKEEASRLMADPNVAATIKAMQEKVAEKVVAKTALTTVVIQERLLALAEQSEKPGDLFAPSTAARCYQLLGLDLGMFVEKPVAPPSAFDLDERDAHELVAILDSITAELNDREPKPKGKRARLEVVR